MPSANWIVFGRGGASAEVDLVGGKARSLLDLTALSLPVPPFFSVTTAAFSAFLAPFREEIDQALADIDYRTMEAVEEGSRAVRETMLDRPLPGELREAIFDAFDEAFERDTRVAVRSSAVGEDSATDSFAGQLDTHLDVSRDGVPDAVRSCFASVFTARALWYRQRRGHEPFCPGAVVVQKLIPSRGSGILFTVDPATGERDVSVVAAGWGLGEGVVADKVETDAFHLDAEGNVLRRRIATKRHRVLPAGGEGRTRLGDVPAGLRNEPVLSDARLRELHRFGKRLEEAFGAPQDVEWALDEESRLHLLQARPITTLREGRERIFDNTNIVEGYPGISSPLTFSFVRRGYGIIFRKAARAFGIPKRRIDESDELFDNMVGYVRGRIYYNILNWYRLYTMIPGLERNLRAWEEGLGLEPREVPTPTAVERLRALPDRIVVLYRMVRNLLCLGRDVRDFKRRFERVRSDFAALTLDALTPDELFETYEDLVRRLLHHWEPTLINDFYTFQLFDRLGDLIERWELGDRDGLRNDLLCGEAGMESVAPVHSLFDLVSRVRADESLKALFESEAEPGRVLERIREEPDFAAFRDAFDRHLDRFGDRTIEELKLETPTAKENPDFVIRSLRNLHRSGQKPQAMEEREQALRKEAEARVRKKLRGHPIRQTIFPLLLGFVRKTVRYREDMRLARSQAFGMVKQIFEAIGACFLREGLLSDRSDIYLLTVDEVEGLIRGGAVTTATDELIALRRREQRRWKEESAPPNRVRMRGVAATAPVQAMADEEGDEAGPGGDGLRGTGCSAGRVRGRARLVRSPEGASIDGEILVARSTDPGWVFLMVAASGIVVERGNPLSHTAIIGRELGIPTVVGVRGALDRIPDGAAIEIDGRTGRVEILGEDAHE